MLRARDRNTVYPSKAKQAALYEQIRAKARELEALIGELTPGSSERAEAFKKIEEAVMWANAAVARHS